MSRRRARRERSPRAAAGPIRWGPTSRQGLEAALLVRCVAMSYPNPEHCGCPDARRIERQALPRERTEIQIAAHLLECSPCLAHYLRELRRAKHRAILLPRAARSTD